MWRISIDLRGFFCGSDRMVKTQQTFKPDQKNHAFYNQVNQTVIKNVRHHTDEILKLSYPIFN